MKRSAQVFSIARPSRAVLTVETSGNMPLEISLTAQTTPELVAAHALSHFRLSRVEIADAVSFGEAIAAGASSWTLPEVD